MNVRLRVGLVGAGPWAHAYTGPMLAGADDVSFVGVWARRPDAARELATTHGVASFGGLDELIEACDALTFSVPPDVQPELAARAARASRAVLLDKPVGADLAQAQALAAAIDDAGVISQMILTYRYLDSMRSFVAAAHRFGAYGGRAAFFGDGGLPGTYFGTPWRVATGGLLDLGPHVLDALDAALGPIVGIEAHGDPLRLVLLECEHAGGEVSQAALSATSHQGGGLSVEVLGLDGRLEFDGGAVAAAETAAAQRRITAEFAACVAAGTPHELDVHRGVHLQRLIDDAARQLRR